MCISDSNPAAVSNRGVRGLIAGNDIVGEGQVVAGSRAGTEVNSPARQRCRVIGDRTIRDGQ